MTIKQFKYLSDFKCLADKCPDNCCYGWEIGVDDTTYKLYQTSAPEMLDFIDKTEDGCHMKKNPNGSGDCIKLKDGLCQIEANYGSKFLSNTCFMFPRVRYQVGNVLMVSAELSCPEITRLCLYGEDPFGIVEGGLGRILPELRNMLEEGESEEDVFNLNQSFINFCANKTISPEQVVIGIIETVIKLEALPKNAWNKAANLFLSLSTDDGIEPMYDEGDPYKLLQIVVLLLHAAKRINRKRLKQILATMESVFQLQIDIETGKVHLSDNSIEIYKTLFAQWQTVTNEETREVLRKYIQAELALSLFPYGKTKYTLYEQAMVLAFKFAFIRLSLISHIYEEGIPLTPETIVRVVQGSLRYLNHTDDLKTLLSLCKDFGWYEKPRLKGMLYSTS